MEQGFDLGKTRQPTNKRNMMIFTNTAQAENTMTVAAAVMINPAADTNIAVPLTLNCLEISKDNTINSSKMSKLSPIGLL